MEMNSIISKLRNKNKKNYYMIIFCNIISIVLITSFSLIYFSPTVQDVFPIGGDSRKQAILVFFIAVVGCMIFTTYASSLFFRYKSTEFGIFMALGEKNKNLRIIILKDIMFIISISFLIGIILSLPAAVCIWKILKVFVIDIKAMSYKFSVDGFTYGIVFCVFSLGCILYEGNKFVRKIDIIEVIQNQRRMEIDKPIKRWYKVAGYCLVFTGLACGYILPSIIVNLYGYMLPAIWNVTYGISLIGIYMIMIHSVMYKKIGKNVGSYYKNIIAISMMRFSGRQTVKNMCLISILILGALFSSFYTPTVVMEMFDNIENKEFDYIFFNKVNENSIAKNEIYNLAKSNNVTINNYNEIESILLITDGIKRDYVDNKLVEEYYEKLKFKSFISESSFNKVYGKKISIQNGEYYKIISKNGDETIWRKWNDINLITNPISNEIEKVKYRGVLKCSSLATKSEDRYVISDKNYYSLSRKLNSDYKERIVLFNVKDFEKTYGFAQKLKDDIINKSSEKSAVIQAYDEYEKIKAVESGEEYWADQYKIDLNPENSNLFLDWKYYPSFKVLDKQDIVKNMAVFLMLFIYTSIICFATVSIIAYTRSIIIAVDNIGLFQNLKKLGASNLYIKNIIKWQIFKIFMYPTLIGSIIALSLDLMILLNNGSRFTPGEQSALIINIIITIGGMTYMYIIHKLAINKVENILEI